MTFLEGLKKQLPVERAEYPQVFFLISWNIHHGEKSKGLIIGTSYSFELIVGFYMFPTKSIPFSPGDLRVAMSLPSHLVLGSPPSFPSFPLLHLKFSCCLSPCGFCHVWVPTKLPSPWQEDREALLAGITNNLLHGNLRVPPECHFTQEIKALLRDY